MSRALNRSRRQQQHATLITSSSRLCDEVFHNLELNPHSAPRFSGGGVLLRAMLTLAIKGEHHVGSILSAGNGCNASGRSAPAVQLCAQTSLGS